MLVRIYSAIPAPAFWPPGFGPPLKPQIETTSAIPRMKRLIFNRVEQAFRNDFRYYA
jgi:hypothetical protein